MYLADLHIHSRFSRATSREGDAAHLDLWARKKGLTLIGTGDFTHPEWRKELKEDLVPAEEGLYRLRPELSLDPETRDAAEAARFVVTGEISSIYKKNGRTRKVHNVIVLKSLSDADRLSARLERIGNIHSDGRPILGLDSRDLAEITFDTCPDAMFIPAHIWTPHFSLFGAFSGFDTIEECFEDMTGEIHALETGLSSDPPMNWRISALDRFTLVSNSDAHSPNKLGREANILDTELTYAAMKRAIETGEGFYGTIEFFPEEGKYHLDGHRNCGLRLTPEETEGYQGLCPICHKKITIGVEHRAEDLSDRPRGANPACAKPFERLVPLKELIGASNGISADGKEAARLYDQLLKRLGPELSILREAWPGDVEHEAGPCVAEGLRRLREGKICLNAGYDGEYGTIRIFEDGERERFLGQMELFRAAGLTLEAKRPKPNKPKKTAEKALEVSDAPESMREIAEYNPEQEAAIHSDATSIAVIAGPGTGKTRTLVARIAYLIEERGVSPDEITAVTFTNQAAEELNERLTNRLGGKKAVRGLTIGTFHAIALKLLDRRPILGEEEAKSLIHEIQLARGLGGSTANLLSRISAKKNGAKIVLEPAEQGIAEEYHNRCRALKVRDLDDLLCDALEQEDFPKKRFRYLLVDEYQDLNALQRSLVLHWNGVDGSLFVIGDPDQSIYGFRGADAECFTALKALRPDLKTICLKTNYRSTPEILSASLHVIQHNPGGARGLGANAASGEKVRLVRAEGTLSEGIFIAKEIARLVGGIDMLEAHGQDESAVRAFSEIAVLARTHRQLEEIESCLRHDGIPCLVTGRGSELKDETVQGALSFFAQMMEPESELQLQCCLTNAYHIEPEKAREMAARAMACAEPLEKPSLPEAFQNDAREFLPLMKKERPKRLIERYAARHGGGEAMEKLAAMAAYDHDMTSFLNGLCLGMESDVKRASGKSYASGAVRLMTLHGAKGLEFPIVFLAGLRKGAFPMERTGEIIDVEEERRLYFVGMTRAKEALILTGASPLSAFADELPDTVTRERAASYQHVPESKQLKLF